VKNGIWKIDREFMFDDVANFQPQAYERLNIFKTTDLPHLLFIGNDGSGRTTTAELFSKRFITRIGSNFKIVYGDDPITKEERKKNNRESRVSSSKVSSMAGKTIRKSPFIKQRVLPFLENRLPNSDPFKILVIKNFHALGMEQQAFRRIMEKYTKKCRMILISDHPSRIILPILSRCQIVTFPTLSVEVFDSNLTQILDQNCDQYEDDVVPTLRKLTNLNLSKSIDLCQRAYVLSNFESITRNSLLKISVDGFQTKIDKMMDGLFAGMINISINILESLIKFHYFTWEKIATGIYKNISRVYDKEIKSKAIKLLAKIDGETTEYGDIRPHLYNLLFELQTIIV
jgi:DNA polymerase III delta prime subunit